MTGQLPAWFGSKDAIPTSSSTMPWRLEAVPHRKRTKEMRPFVPHFALGVFAVLLEACDCSLAYVISRVGEASPSSSKSLRFWCAMVNDVSFESRNSKTRALRRRRR
jgi:hypothetical protein